MVFEAFGNILIFWVCYTIVHVYLATDHAEIALTQKSCIFMQTKCKKCIMKILMHPRTQDVDLKNSLHLL